ncbi:MAG: hypothetical protein JWM43_3840 [Acidobacteriaceae bacterium]|nr:hypothetical protein [Acidobacteriaceae bacterium]
MLAFNEAETTGKQSLREGSESSERVAEALADILRSPRFKDSQQLQSLLRYVVDEVLKGNEDALKERLIGVYVFGRRPDYDTADDPIVRSRMGLLRKRLAQYYEGEDGGHAAVQIVIPNGTYRPTFVFQQVTKAPRTKALLAEAETPSLPSVDPEDTIIKPIALPTMVRRIGLTTVIPWTFLRKRSFRIGAVAAAGALILLGSWWFYFRTSQRELDSLWAPIVKGKQPIYVYTGTMPVFEPESPADEATSPADLSLPIHLPEPPPADAPQIGPDRVFSYGEGMLTGSVYADIRVAGLLTKYSRTPVLRSGANLPFMDLKGSPLILIGSFDNYWTRVMNENLPFYFDRGFGILEREGTHRRWHNPLKAEMTPRMMEDYALVFRVMNSKAGAPVLGIAGLSTCGTHAAADFVTDPAQMRALSGISRASLRNSNIELVLHTSLVNCLPTSVEVIATKVW